MDWITSTRLHDHDRLRLSLSPPPQSGAEKRVGGPPPQPSIPAVRQAITDLFTRPPPCRFPHCEKLLADAVQPKLPKQCFCNGPSFVKSPLNDISSPGSCFCPWSARRPPHHAIRSRADRSSQSRKPGLPKHSQHHTRACQARVPATGPQESRAVSARSKRSISYAIVVALLQRKSVAFTHMRWSTTPNLRARATWRASCPGVSLHRDARIACVSMMCAAQRLESPSMAAQDSRQILVDDEACPDKATEAKHHGE